MKTAGLATARIGAQQLHRAKISNPVWGHRSRGMFICLALITIVFLSTALALASSTERFQTSGIPPAAGPGPNLGQPQLSAPTQDTSKQSAPDAARWPFLRFIGVLLSGLIISAARLARMFRRFWGLGVFINRFAALYLVIGAILSCLPMTLEHPLSSVPHMESLGPWVAAAFGIVLTLFFPAIPLKSRAPQKEEDGVRDLANASSSNTILALVEDGVRDHIQVRMRIEFIRLSVLYDWDTIILAGSRALEEEIALERLGRQDGDNALHSLQSLRTDTNPYADSSNKYMALLHLIRWCSFRQLRDGLAAAAPRSS
jgi:hypothetical protein